MNRTMTPQLERYNQQPEELPYMELGGIAMQEIFAADREQMQSRLNAGEIDQLDAADAYLRAHRAEGVDLMLNIGGMQTATERQERSVALEVSNKAWGKVAAAELLEQQQHELLEQFRIFTSESDEKNPRSNKKDNKELQSSAK